MKAKRRWVKIFMRFFAILLVLVLFVVSSNIIYEVLFKMVETTIQENYRARKEKFDFLKTIAVVCIEEGKGINPQKIQNEDVCFKLYNEGENIIFHYYIDEEIFDIKATITLDKDYKILDEEYAEIKSYEKSKNECQIFLMFLSVFVDLFAWIAICISAKGIYLAVKWIIKFF